jgi:hypothetical protein
MRSEGVRMWGRSTKELFTLGFADGTQLYKGSKLLPQF